ncbi:L-amino-acid oxidase-like [Mercenaria mercenaria]|uniref:L-amino-acid oxidase-like n=1 Tax=Mercenaria mercenaria TaxID=6596 RepID=UPI00234E993C|nr:L-amino-acid oxidase-like [Mercenaria mercenaria]
MGALRFVPSWHPLLNKTIHELGLAIEDVTMAPTGKGDTLYYLRGKHMSYSELPVKAPYNIPENYRIDYDTLNWQIYMNFTTESSRSETLTSENKQYIKSLDGVDLYMQSWDIFSGKFLDKETTAYIEDAAGYDDGFAGTSAAQYVPRSKQSEWNSARFKTITKGFQALPTTMLEQFLNESVKHRFYRNHHLRSIKRNQNGMYLITFQPTETVAGITSDVQGSAARTMCARKVLLAVPKLALENIDWDVLNNDRIRDILTKSLVSIHGTKMFFGYDKIWWRNIEKSSSSIVSDTHLRATYDFVNLQSKTTPKAVYMIAYPDLSNEYWRLAQASGNPVPGVGDKSLEMTNTSVNIARNYLSQIFNVSMDDIPSPTSAVMSIWDQYPIGAAWYAWAPGYKMEEVESTMLRPSTTEEVYIISNTFNRNSGWTEGALEVVEKVLKLI